ncbi:MAG TPA: four helix bundle protein [Saprospiraceae bacterium]|nr:four helix bundle protein [Saprospiraceae bacterium]HNT22109.1 four helix bundle protein [Saprospiraceae bacterium]
MENFTVFLSENTTLMRISRFEDILAWQKGQDLAVEVYLTLHEIKDWDFRSQINRAAVSVSNNIAEGFDRHTNKEFIKFLTVARASCSEVKSMLYLAERLGYLEKHKSIQLLLLTVEISKMINGLIKVLRKPYNSTSN